MSPKIKYILHKIVHMFGIAYNQSSLLFMQFIVLIVFIVFLHTSWCTVLDLYPTMQSKIINNWMQCDSHG